MSRRIRTIKPEILDDDKTASLSHVAWRLFVSALSLSDDHGNLRAGVTYLSGQVFHSCQDTDPDTVRAAVAELAEVGLWTVYNVRGQTYAHIRGWSKHQRIDNAGKPKVPGPNEADGTDPISAEAKNKVRGESRRVAANLRESRRFAAVRGWKGIGKGKWTRKGGGRVRAQAPTRPRVCMHARRLPPPRRSRSSWPPWSRRRLPHRGPHQRPCRSCHPSRLPRPAPWRPLSLRPATRTMTSPHRPSACRLRPVLSLLPSRPRR